MNAHAAGRDERTVRRIVTLLVALAVLAERAAVRSLPVRWFVLLILRRAETAAEEFVLEATGTPPAAEGFVVTGNGPDDALGLAARLRALAAALGAMLPEALRRDRRPAWRGFAFGHVAPGPGRVRGGWTRQPNDTS